MTFTVGTFRYRFCLTLYRKLSPSRFRRCLNSLRIRNQVVKLFVHFLTLNSKKLINPIRDIVAILGQFQYLEIPYSTNDWVVSPMWDHRIFPNEIIRINDKQTLNSIKPYLSVSARKEVKQFQQNSSKNPYIFITY